MIYYLNWRWGVIFVWYTINIFKTMLVCEIQLLSRWLFLYTNIYYQYKWGIHKFIFFNNWSHETDRFRKPLKTMKYYAAVLSCYEILEVWNIHEPTRDQNLDLSVKRQALTLLTNSISPSGSHCQSVILWGRFIY